MSLRCLSIRIRFQTHTKTPYFIGSQIRGSLGYALKETVCINPTYCCEGCFAASNCLYFDWYEAKDMYHFYRLDIELGKPYYDVGVYLFADTVEKLPYVVSALHRMLTKHGLGTKRLKPHTYELYINDIRANDAQGHITLPEVAAQYIEFTPISAPVRLHLRLVTPLRIKHANRFVRSMEHLHLHSLIRSIHRRYLLLTGLPETKLDFRVEGEITDRYGVFTDLTRYSSRQKGKLQIGGMVGEMTIEDIDERSYALLKIGEIIGVGKQTVFGLGKIQVDII
jgi:hypothetical protein